MDRFQQHVLDGPDSTLQFQIAAVKRTPEDTVVVTAGAVQTASDGVLNVTNIVVGGGEGAFGHGHRFNMSAIGLKGERLWVITASFELISQPAVYLSIEKAMLRPSAMLR